MKFLERALLLMYLMGLYFVFLQQPPDYSLIFVSATSFAAFYVLTMPFLLQGIVPAQLFRRATPKALRWHHLVSGFLFGICCAYTVFAVTFHVLGSMDALALAENCGLFLLLAALVAWWMRRNQPDLFYRRLFVRAGIFALIVLGALLAGWLKR